MLNHNNHFHVQGARPTAVFRIICSALKVLLPKEKIKRRLMPRTEQNERRVSAFHWRVTSGALALGAMFVLAVLGTRPAQAQTTIETVLHNFASPLPKGGLPLAGVIRDSAGNLYGTTSWGGAANAGVVYKLNASGNYTVLYSFTGGADGASPWAGVIPDSAGNLYGTTFFGGASGAGVVYKLNASGQETVLYSFTGLADGCCPRAGVIRDSAGNLYGTTNRGGALSGCVFGCGVVYKLNASGRETVLHTFTGGADGGDPNAGVIRDSAGNLYGTTGGGGTAGKGGVLKGDTAGNETVLYGFTGGADGSDPNPSVIRDSAGNLYGTTIGGGTAGKGVAFKVDTSGNETVLYSFTGGADGANPWGGLFPDSAGNLYGTTDGGGAANAGVVFKLNASGNN